MDAGGDCCSFTQAQRFQTKPVDASVAQKAAGAKAVRQFGKEKISLRNYRL